MMRLGAAASIVEYKEMKFAITYMPDKICTKNYFQDLQQYDTRRLVNTTERTYCPEMFNRMGIEVNELYFPDGTFPENAIIDQWLQIVRDHLEHYPATTLAVHDETGLGRSAVLVAIALMESGAQPHEAIDLIRKSRRGAFNNQQLEHISKYKTQYLLVERGDRSFFGLITKKPSPPDGNAHCSLSACSKGKRNC